MVRSAGFVAAAVALWAGAARAEVDAGPFAQGSSRVSLILGGGNDGWVIGGGYGYYLVDGLELGLEAEHWFGRDPTVTQLTPNLRYVLFFVPVLKPYAGGFYRHWFVSGQDDIDSLGARGGLFYVSGSGSYLGGGVVYEKYVTGCDKDCSQVYPEVSISLSF
jgi:hypothetical protein